MEYTILNLSGRIREGVAREVGVLDVPVGEEVEELVPAPGLLAHPVPDHHTSMKIKTKLKSNGFGETTLPEYTGAELQFDKGTGT